MVDTQNLVFVGGFMGSFAVALVAMSLLPFPYGNYVGGALYFTVLMLVFGLGKWSTQLKYDPYPHYEAVVLPGLEKFNIFADPNTTTMSVNDGGECGTAHFGLKFPQQIMNMGKKIEVIIQYEGNWFSRTMLRSRTITVGGFSFSHHGSDMIILKPVPNGGLFLDHGQEIPCFKLVTGSRDEESTHNLETDSSSKGSERQFLACGKCGAPMSAPTDGKSNVECPYCKTTNRIDG